MQQSFVSRLVRAGLTTAICDGIFSSVLVSVFYGSTVTRLWQGVASTLLGKEAMDGGMQTAAIGLLMHVGVAFGWSAVFLLLVMNWSWLRNAIASPGGMIAVACVYGPLIWLVMSIGIIPQFVHRPPTINFRWWVQLIGHIPAVVIPIVWSIRATDGGYQTARQ